MKKRMSCKINILVIMVLLVCLLLIGCIEIDSEDGSELQLITEPENQDENSAADEAMNGSQILEGYYKETYELSGMQLKRKLNEIITKNHGALSYDQVYSALEDTDEDPNDPSKVLLFYKGISVPDNELRMSDDGDIWNREHIWAKSHGDFGTTRGPGTDLHMIRPTDASINARRGHLDFDESDKAFDEASGTYVDKDSFEPRDEVKGDVARMLFYMAIRYEGNDGEVDLELSNRTDTFDLTDTGYGEHGKLDTLLEWHLLDPVDSVETTRNDVIHKIQGNRNPFIDYPEFVELIWGESSSAEYEIVEEQNNDQLVKIISIESARNMADGQKVTVLGTVIYQENDTTLYIQDEQGGIKINSYGVDINFYDDMVDRKIIIEGQLDTYKGEKEIQINEEGGFTILDSINVYEPIIVMLSELSDGDYQGQLIQVDNVEVIEVMYKLMTVEDENGFLMTIFYGKANNFDVKNIKVGKKYNITGIAAWYDDIQIKLMDGSGIKIK